MAVGHVTCFSMAWPKANAKAIAMANACNAWHAKGMGHMAASGVAIRPLALGLRPFAWANRPKWHISGHTLALVVPHMATYKYIWPHSSTSVVEIFIFRGVG